MDASPSSVMGDSSLCSFSSVSSTSSTASADALFQQKYDVFISFRGTDTRRSFTSHLYNALKGKKIYTYMDDKSLERGDEIGPALLTAIEQSKVSIVIFSQHYAESKWCLEELVHILKSKELYGQQVVPVFYDTDPSHVRRQEGSYADAFEKYETPTKERTYSPAKIRMWRDALTAAGNLSGFDTKNIRDDAELIDTIIEVTASKLNRGLSADSNSFFGNESRVREIERLLSFHSHDVPVQTVGIWGQRGAGKTTLAASIYRRYYHQFEACSFLANVREKTEKYGVDHLKNKLVFDLLKVDDPSIPFPSLESTLVTSRLSRTKVLIVLDDVSDLMQSKWLLGDQVQFGRGSRIIVTTNEWNVLKALVDDDQTYQVTPLDDEDSVRLFQSIALKDISFGTDYIKYSREVAEFAQGIPLTLKVLGSLFRDCNSNESWKQELKRLKRLPNKDIKNVLRLGYDRLEENERDIFLDIACFLKGEKRCDAERVLEMHGLDARGITTLICASLISISTDNRIECHDVIEEIGKSIVQEQCCNGKMSRLWNIEEALGLKGPSTVGALFLDISPTKIPRRQLIGDHLFRYMSNLRLLRLYVPLEPSDLCQRKERLNSSSIYELVDVEALQRTARKIYGISGLKGKLAAAPHYCSKAISETHSIYKSVMGILQSLPESLRYLYWDGYPYKFFPSRCLDNLVELHMPHSQIKRLNWWPYETTLGNLKVVNLRDSKSLVEVPDLSQTPSIEILDLSGCSSIPKLMCEGKNKNRIALKELLLSWCTSLDSVTDYIFNFTRLETLDLRGCRKLQTLPSIPEGRSYPLRVLNLSWCKMLSVDSVPCGLICSSSIQDIALSGTMIESIPASIKNCFGLRKLLLINCQKLQSLPELPSQLEILDAAGCTSLKTVATSSNYGPMQDGAPDPITPQEKLMFTKSLDHSRKIELVEYKEHEQAKESKDKLDSGLDVPKLIEHNGPWLGEAHIFTNCFSLDESSRSNIIGNAQRRIMRLAASKREYGTIFATCPGNQLPEWFSHQNEGCSIQINFPETDEKFVGFALSAVFATQNQQQVSLFRLRCRCNFKTDDGKGYEFRFETPLAVAIQDSSSEDNVLVFFQKDMFCGSPEIPLDKITEALFSFPDGQDKEECKVNVKKCGIKILYI